VKWHRVSFPGAKRPGRGVNHAPHLAPSLKECSYTSTLPLGLHGLFEGGLSWQIGSYWKTSNVG